MFYRLLTLLTIVGFIGVSCGGGGDGQYLEPRLSSIIVVECDDNEPCELPEGGE